MFKFNLDVARNEMIMKLYFSFCCYMLIWLQKQKKTIWNSNIGYGLHIKYYSQTKLSTGIAACNLQT